MNIMTKEELRNMPITELEDMIRKLPCNSKHALCRLVYAERLLNGIGCVKNERRALDCFEEIAFNNEASLQAGLCYFYGIGCEPNYKKALRYFDRLGDGDFSKKRYLWKGKCLLKIREKGAVNCFHRVVKDDPDNISAEKIRKEAGFLLGMCYYYGVDTEKNVERAFDFFKMAAQGNGARLEAKYYLALCYEKGIGTFPDAERAEHWRAECFNQDLEKLIEDMKGLLWDTTGDGVLF